MALAALIIMTSGWFQRWLERQVIAGLEDVSGGRVEVSSFRFRPWVLQIRMQKLVIHGSEPTDEAPLLSAGDVEVGLSPRALVRRQLRLRHLDVDALQVHLRTDSHGITNLPKPGGHTSPQQSLAKLMNLSIGRLTISHSVFFWNDQRQPLEIDARELAVLLRMSQGRYTGALSSAGTLVRSGRWSPPPINLNSRFELSHAGLVFSWFAWHAQGMDGEAAFSILANPTLRASGSFRTTTELGALGRVLRIPQLRAGTLELEGLAGYQDGNFTARGRTQVRNAVINMPALPSLPLSLAADYSLGKDQLDLSDLVASIWEGTIHGTLQANFERTPAKFRLESRVQHLQLSNLLRIADGSNLIAAQLRPAALADGDLRATWTGQVENLQADFALALQPPPSGQGLPVSGLARGTLENGNGFTLHLEESELHTPHSTIQAHGTLAERASAATASDPLVLVVTTNDFEEWRPFFEKLVATPHGIPLQLNAPAGFSGELGGSYEAPSIQGHVNMGQFVYQGWTWDQLSASVLLNPELIQISGGRVHHGRSFFEMDGSARLDQWRLTPSSTVQLSALARRTPIEGLIASVNSDLPLRGSVTGHVDIEGTPAALSGSGVLRIDDGAFSDEPFDSFSTHVQVSHSVWKLQNLAMKKTRGHLSGNLTLEPGRRFASGELKGADFHLADFRRLPINAPGAISAGRLDGSLDFDAHGQGTPENFHAQSSWRLQNLNLAGAPLGQVQGKLRGEGSQLIIEGEDHGSAGNLRFRAHAAARGDWPMEAEGEYSSLRADPWIRAFLNRAFGAAVSLGGSFKATGPLRSPAKMELQSHAQDVAVDFPTLQWRNVQPVNLKYADNRITLSRFIMRGPSTELAIEGMVDCTHGVALALGADGTANATLLTVFDSKVEATGRSTLRLRLTGTLDRPLLNGSIDIHDVSLGYGDLPFRFNGLQGTIRLEGERAAIHSLQGTSGGGKVELSGFVTLVQNPRYEVRAELSQVHVRYPTSFTSVLDGNLRLAGGVDQAQLQGEIFVRQMAINEKVDFITRIIQSSNPLPEPPVGVSAPLAAKIRLNVRVTSAPPVQLQTPNLRLSGDIDLRLQGTLADPVQVGSIHFLSGETVFRGNRYTLVRGDMNMTNPFRTQAYLDMEVQTQVQNYDLTLDLTGPLDRLKVSYRSDPPLAQTDILSLLALGYVKQEGAFSTTAGNPSAAIGASAILSEALSSQTTSRIQHLFGVSRIKIDPNVGIPGFGAGALVTVEQQLTHDLTLTYVTDTSYSQYRIIQFEWNISDKVSVLGVRDQNGVFGIEFRFRQRFK